MTSDLTLYAPPSASDLEQSWQLAGRLHKTEFVPNALRGRPEAVLACILAGRELGLGPMQALQSIHIIQGRPTMSADLMVGLVRRHGHKIRTIDRTDEKAVVEGIRADDPEHVERVEFTIADARRAKLLGKDNWQQYPAAMLWARAVSALCRITFNDVLHGVAYVPEELGDDRPPTTTVEVGPAEVDPERDGILADGWNSLDEQHEAHRRLNVYLAEHQLGSWFDRWLASNRYQRPLSTGQMEELRGEVQRIEQRRQDLADPEQSGGLSAHTDTIAGRVDVSGSPPDPSPPSPTEPEALPQADHSGAGGAHVDAKPGTGQENPPTSTGATTPPESTAAPLPPGRRSSGGSNRSGRGGQPGASRPAEGKRQDSAGTSSPAGTDEEELRAYEQKLADT